MEVLRVGGGAVCRIHDVRVVTSSDGERVIHVDDVVDRQRHVPVVDVCPRIIARERMQTNVTAGYITVKRQQHTVTNIRSGT